MSDQCPEAVRWLKLCFFACRNGEGVGVAFFDVQVSNRLLNVGTCIGSCTSRQLPSAWCVHAAPPVSQCIDAQFAASQMRGVVCCLTTRFAAALLLLEQGLTLRYAVPCHASLSCRSSSCTRVLACAQSMRKSGQTLVGLPSV